MVGATVVIPRGFDTKKILRAVDNSLNGAALAAKIDFNVTTKTWKHKPKFNITKKWLSRKVSTKNLIYKFVDGGTRPHVITANNPSGLLTFKYPTRPKTVPNKIRSNKGSTGKKWASKQSVNHPGTKARDLTKTIAEKWRKKLPIIVQRAIDSEVG